MSSSYLAGPGDIIHLNVGGERFSTSKQTLSWLPDTFFTSLLSGRISTLRDETGAIFIDRDPTLFRWVLHYLRTREINTRGLDIAELKHEAEFYGVAPLVKRLSLCQDLTASSCGDVLFCGYLAPPNIPVQEGSSITTTATTTTTTSSNRGGSTSTTTAPTTVGRYSHSRNNSLDNRHPGAAAHENEPASASASSSGARSASATSSALASASAVSMVHSMQPPSHSRGGGERVPEGGSGGALSTGGGGLNSTAGSGGGVGTSGGGAGGGDYWRTHSRTPSLDCRHHSRNSSADLNKLFKIEIGVLNNVGGNGSCWVDPLRVRMVKAHHNWIVVAYAHFVTCYRNKDSTGWQLAFTSPHQPALIERVAINAKMSAAGQPPSEPAAAAAAAAAGQHNKMLAIAYGSYIRLWGVGDDGSCLDVGTFHLGAAVEYLFFIGYQLVALSSVEKIGVWHAMTRNWQTQDVLPIASFDTAGSFLLLGCTNGSIYYIDMQKFPLRMKDNDLLVTELYHDPSNDVITAISVYLTPKTNVCGNWIEIAYGTSSGTVRVIVQHPETVGHGPQLFQTFTVHRHPVTKVRLSEKLLMSVCSEYNHVRTWSVMRFRGMISTQPGSTPLSSYKLLTLEEADQPALCAPHANDIGPYGEQDDEQVFIQKVVPETDQLIVRLASKGKRVCVIKSVDGSSISGFCVHECDGRIGSTRPRRYLFTGHTSGAIQMWDLTTALDMINKPEAIEDGSPEPSELLRLLDCCELSYSHGTTPCVSPSPHHAAALLHHHHLLSHHPPPPPPHSPHHPLPHALATFSSYSASQQSSFHLASQNSYNGHLHNLQQQSHNSNLNQSSSSLHNQSQSSVNQRTSSVGSHLSSSTEGKPSRHQSVNQECQTSDSMLDLQEQFGGIAVEQRNIKDASSRLNPINTNSGDKLSPTLSPPHRPHLTSSQQQQQHLKRHQDNTEKVPLHDSLNSSTSNYSASTSCNDSENMCRSFCDAPAVGQSRNLHNFDVSIPRSSNSRVATQSISSGVVSGHMLKPANVAFLSHNQTGVKRAAKQRDAEEGTPC